MYTIPVSHVSDCLFFLVRILYFWRLGLLGCDVIGSLSIRLPWLRINKSSILGCGRIFLSLQGISIRLLFFFVYDIFIVLILATPNISRKDCEDEVRYTDLEICRLLWYTSF